MKLKKPLWSLARLALPALGFALISFGAYMVSLKNTHDSPLTVVPAYVMVALGFLLMVSGVFWSVCHSMKSKMYQRGGPRQRVHVFSIDRPSSFPPSYEESQSSQFPSPPSLPQQTLPSEVVLPIVLAPPLYSQDSSVLPDCSWSWEPPPHYSQVAPLQDTSPAR